MSNIIEWFKSFRLLLFPLTCSICGTTLGKDEECICHKCNEALPRTNLHLQADNKIERMFWGKVPIVRASSYFYYHKGGNFRMMIHKMKYSGRKEYGLIMGRMMASELKEAGFFEGVDKIIPVPLHPGKYRKRGYNQSEWIARGVSEVTGIPLHTDIVKRAVNNATQTHKNTAERWRNVEGVFKLSTKEDLSGQHILIIDDVLTTGATTSACANAVTDAYNVHISVLTLAIAE